MQLDTNNHLTVAVGICRCGKSTYGKKWLDQKISEGKRAIIANADSLRLTITGQRYVRSAEPVVHMVNRYIIMDFFRNGYDVYVDETNTTKQNLVNWLEIDPDLEFVYFDTPVEECERRAYESGQPDLVEKGVIKRHATNLEELVRNHHPRVAVRYDGMHDQSYFLSNEMVMNTLEEIQREFKERKQ